MKRYVLRQLMQLVVVIIGISILSFGILYVLGDPVLLLLPQNAGKEEYDRYHRLLGPDKPLYAVLEVREQGGAGRFGSRVRGHAGVRLVLERMPPPST